MSGCGYVCPLCEGRGVDENGNPCTYCTEEQQAVSEENSCDN